MSRYYAIAVADPRPAMTQTYTFATVDTYADAVAAAHAMFRITGRSVYLYGSHPPAADGRCVPESYYLHYIKRDGTFTDRNTNSGVSKSGVVA